MFFGNGLGTPILQLLATHPPLVERIRRIDPNFDGQFPPVTARIEYSPATWSIPATLAARRAGRPASLLLALPRVAAATGRGRYRSAAAAARWRLGRDAGSRTFAFEPAAAVAQVGAPRSEHLDYAAALLARSPPNSRPPCAIRWAPWPRSTHCCSTPTRDRAPQPVGVPGHPGQSPGKRRNAASRSSWQPNSSRRPGCRWSAWCLPALKGLSPSQLSAFHDDVNFLIQADHHVSLFEYAVHRLILKRLLGRLQHRQPTAIKYDRLAPLLPASSALLSALAYCGTRDDRQAAARWLLALPSCPAEAPGSSCCRAISVD